MKWYLTFPYPIPSSNIPFLKPSRIAIFTTKLKELATAATATAATTAADILITTIIQRTPQSKEDNSHREEAQANAHPHARLLHRPLPLPDDDGTDVGGQDHGNHVHGPPHRCPQVSNHDRPDAVDKKASEPHQPHAEGDKEVEEEHFHRLLTILYPAPKNNKFCCCERYNRLFYFIYLFLKRRYIA